jgi:hypothetical protein
VRISFYLVEIKASQRYVFSETIQYNVTETLAIMPQASTCINKNPSKTAKLKIIIHVGTDRSKSSQGSTREDINIDRHGLRTANVPAPSGRPTKEE